MSSAKGEPDTAGGGVPSLVPPPRPAACREVPAGGPLQPWIDRALPGEALCLAPGEHVGPIRVPVALTLWGPPQAVLRSREPGPLAHVTGRGARLAGFRVQVTPSSHDRESAALRVSADEVVLDGLDVVDATFGVLVERARGVRLRGNRIAGVRNLLTGLRGDALRLWEARDTVLEDNEVRWARDIVVWYSPGSVFRRNRILHGRYGLHFMYSADSVIEDNHVESCVVGAFVMYSRGIRLERNAFVNASGAAGMGVGLKESGNVTLRENVFVRDTIGLYLDTSPLYVGDRNHVERNRFFFSDAAVTFHGRAEGNEFVGNELRSNRRQVDVEGGGDALASHWLGNAFDDYVGYDLDADGVGDVAYALRSVTSELVARYPELGYFRGAPALGIVEAIAGLVPLMTPRTLIVDAEPRTAPVPRASAGVERGSGPS